jgi:hypothetical protein
MAIDRTENTSAGECGPLYPGLKDANRAGVGIGTIGYTDLPALAVLIGLRPPQCHRQAILSKAAILNIQASEFRPPERSGKSEQD